MQRFTVKVGQVARDRLDACARALGFGTSDAIRHLLALGLGLDEDAAAAIRAQVAEKRQRAEMLSQRAREPGPRERASMAAGKTQHAPVVCVKLPKGLAQLVQDTAGFKRALNAGLDLFEKRHGVRLTDAAANFTGYVYLISDVQKRVKIGWTTAEPTARLAALQTGNADPLQLIGVLTGTSELELQLHKQFAAKRIPNTEWFRLTPREIAEILGLTDEDRLRLSAGVGK